MRRKAMEKMTIEDLQIVMPCLGGMKTLSGVVKSVIELQGELAKEEYKREREEEKNVEV